MSDANTDRAEQPAVAIVPPVAEPKLTQPSAKQSKGPKPLQAPRSKAPRPAVKKEAVPKQPQRSQQPEAAPQVVPVPANAPILAPVPQPKIYTGNFLKNANDWTPEVERGKEADRYLASLSITARYPRDGVLNNTNQHPCQAAERALATARALGFLYGNGIRRVTSVYGSPRDDNIVSFCNAKVSPNERLEMTRYSPAITAKDFTRKPTSITYGDSVRNAQALFLVDVYHTDMRPSAPFCPDVIADMVTPMTDFVGGNRVVWIGRCYYGDAGMVCNEGGWYRTDEGNIVFRSSPEEPTEYKHDPCDWLWKSQAAKITINRQPYVLSWSVVKVVGTFKIVSFNITAGMMEATNFELYPYQTKFVSVRCYNQNPGWFLTTCMDYIPWFSTLSRRWSPLFETKKLYGPIYDAARGAVNQKRYTQTNFDRVATALQVAHEQPQIVCFLKLFPFFAIKPKDYAGFTWGILTDDIEERKVNLYFSRHIDAGQMAEVNEMQSQIGVTPSLVINFTTQRVLGGVAALGGLFVLWKAARTFRRVQVQSHLAYGDWTINWPYNALLLQESRLQTNNLIVNILSGFAITGVVIPAIEEVVKKAFVMVGLGWLFPVFEYLQYLQHLNGKGLNVFQSTLLRLPALIMHSLTLRMPFWKGLLFHALFNIVLAPLYMVLIGSTTAIHGISVERSTVVQGRSRWFVLLGLAAIGAVYYLRSKVSFPFHTEYERWKQQFYSEEWTSRGSYQDPRSFSCPIQDWRVPESESPIVPDSKILNGSMSSANCIVVSGILTPPEKPKLPQFFYHILPTSAPGFVPAASHHNLTVAIEQRLLKPPFLLPELQKRHWNLVTKNWGQGLLDSIGPCDKLDGDWIDLVDQWVDHFEDTRKRKRYQEAVSQLKREPLLFQVPKETNLFVKHDEMLMQQKDGCYTLKPRVIANVDPSFQARVGPYVYAAQKRLGSIWSVHSKSLNVVDFKHGAIRPTYFHFMLGGGTSDHDLSLWMQNVLYHTYVPSNEIGFCLLVCGDDSVIAFNYMGKVWFIEGDASMFDQSISFGPIGWGIKVLRHLGVWERVLNALYKAHGISYVVKNPNKRDSHATNYTLSLHQRYMQATGIATTYILNSIVMMSACYFALREIQRGSWQVFLNNPTETLKQQFGYLGFSMKMRITDDFRRVTFLKGLWYATPEPVWGPLPSRILKMGKSLKDPRHLYGMTSCEEAGLNFLRDVASSYAVFLQVPIVRAFVQRYQGIVVRPHASARANAFTSTATGTYASLELDDNALEAVCARYNVTMNEIKRVEELILKSKPLTFLHDPVFQQLAAVDYA